jgi:fatty-acyl-CoA synthase
MATYIEDLVAVLHRAGPRAVLRYAGADTSGTELLAEICRYARALDGLGVGRGDLVALFAPNRPEALAVRYAAHLIGAATVYLPAPDEPGRRAELVAHLAPSLVVVFPETADLLPADVPAPTVTVGAVRGLDTDAASRLDQLAAVRAQPGDVAVVASSGGTTGVPKGSVRDFASYTRLVAVSGPAQDRRQLANGKLAYLTQVLVDQTLLAGGTVVLQDGFDPVATLAAIERDRITHLFLVEPQLFALMDHRDLAGYDLTSLRALTHIGSTAAPVLRRRARERLGPVVMHTYGASEVGIVSALTPAEHDRPARFRSAGRIQPGIDVRFRRSNGTLDPRAGAIEVRSPAMAHGYRNRPVEDAAHFIDG